MRLSFLHLFLLGLLVLGLGPGLPAPEAGPAPILRDASLPEESPSALESSAPFSPQFHAERQRTERARYLFEIEGDAAAAARLLEPLLAVTVFPEIRAWAHFLLGRLDEKEGRTDSALSHYREAIGGRKLPVRDQLWLYQRLAALDPRSLRAMQRLEPLSGPVRQAFPVPGPGGISHTLLLQPAGAGAGLEIGVQGPEGLYRRSPLRLRAGDQVLDADDHHALLFSRGERRLAIRALFSRAAFGFELPARLEDARLLSAPAGAESPEALLLLPGKVMLLRGDRPVFEAAIEGRNCGFIDITGRPREALVRCAEGSPYRVDAAQRRVVAVGGLSQRPVSLHATGTHLAVKYLDRVEVRSGSDYASLRFTFPSPLQEKLFLSATSLLAMDQKGLLKSYSLASGRLEWQKDVMGQHLFPLASQWVVLTFAQTCIGLDLAGKQLWSYEYGWDRDVRILPSEEVVLVHDERGGRIKLDRHLLELTGNAGETRFLEYRRRLAARDPAGALASLDSLLALEPGNGLAWRHRYECLRLTGANRALQMQALVQAARSPLVPPYASSHPTLKSLAQAVGARWVWKRQYGPKFYPIMAGQKGQTFYLENDNRTLVVLENETGSLVHSFHFGEELDMKVGLWRGDTLVASSPGRLYFLYPRSGAGPMDPIALENPVCQALSFPEGILHSDWFGGISFLALPGKTRAWSRRLGESGILLAAARGVEEVDAVDLEGRYFALDRANGETRWSTALPAGTATEVFSSRDGIYIGYSNGLLCALDRASQKVRWTRDLEEQIFSLGGTRDLLVLTLADKRLLHLDPKSGRILRETGIPVYLFNRPTLTENAYWLGTTEPSLQRRSHANEVLGRYRLPDLPGNPLLVGDKVLVHTLDNFLFAFGPD